MFDGLLKDQIRGDPEIAGMLGTYNGFPAFFFQKSPNDKDRDWGESQYPRVDYNIDMRYDPERKAAGTLIINVLCTSESAVMPEDIERRLVSLINGAFYTDRQRATVCAVWNRSDAFGYQASTDVTKNTAPEIIGVTLTFDVLQFPEQMTIDPDPIQGLNQWTQRNFPGMALIGYGEIPPIWKPTDAKPAIYWRFESTSANDRQTYAVNWYTGQFAAHVIADTIKERNGWTKAIAEQIQIDGEIVLPDGSPMFAKQIAIRHNSDPLRDGQLLLTGQYGVQAQRRKEYAELLLTRSTLSQGSILQLEATHGSENRK